MNELLTSFCSSATLNVDRLPFCIDNNHLAVKLPIYLNETVPTLIQLLRLDFDTNAKEVIEIKSKEVQKLMKQSAKKHQKDKTKSLVLEYTVKKPGLYRLHKVLDISNLEVQRHMSDTFVVECPSAVVQKSSPDRCVGDLSDLTVIVKGTPPMKIVYSRTINQKDQSFHFQSIQPQNLISPLLGAAASSTLESVHEEDVSWGRSYSIEVRLNESMTPSGKWLYSIDEIHDATGNVANFSARGEDGEHLYPKGTQLEHTVDVHERPEVRFKGCDTHNPLKVAIGASAALPVEFGSPGNDLYNTKYTVAWQFSSIDKLTASGDHGEDMVIEQFISKNSRQKPVIHRAGLYTLKTVSNQFCDGEIMEPASCLLLNPPEPNLSITSKDIYDKCAGNSIGLLVDLDLIGTPPFVVHYEIIQNKQRKSHKVRVDGSRHQLELKPTDAGHFTYRFTSIDDHIYGAHPLSGEALTLEQDVKPPASAYLIKNAGKTMSCIEESVQVDVVLQGEPPFALEYELVHNGKRKKYKVPGIAKDVFTISTEPLAQGGDYTLALVSVQDKMGCKIFLSDEMKIAVRQQRPKASFGVLDGKRKVMALEGETIRLPLRLEGISPWHISYRKVNDSSDRSTRIRKESTNDILQVDQCGVYELFDVSDSDCPGSIDHAASTFEVDWIARPKINIPDNAGLTLVDDKYWKREVCEGDVDAVEINLVGKLLLFLTFSTQLMRVLGSPPYHIEYQHRYKPEHGSTSFTKKTIDVALGIASIPMDTTNAGLHMYAFSELSDNFYGHDPRSRELLVQQMVNPKPSATFLKPGHSYTYCKAEEAGDEVISISLKGVPPFYLEIDIKHQSSSRPETVKIANVEINRYEFRIPHHVLSLGIHHVSVRKVRDARGCQQKTEFGAPHVQVQVFDVPTIYPLEARSDYCVGERISYTLSGTPPFEIYYNFGGVQRKAKSSTTNFRRIAEKPGKFTITAISDKASECRASVDLTKTIHEMPSVKISKGRQTQVDIHEGGEAEILFEFWGTPPFEFTYTRSTNAKKGQKSKLLETKHEISYEHSKAIKSSQEGTYEVIAIKDKYCSFSTQRMDSKTGQKLLQM